MRRITTLSPGAQQVANPNKYAILRINNQTSQGLEDHNNSLDQIQHQIQPISPTNGVTSMLSPQRKPPIHSNYVGGTNEKRGGYFNEKRKTQLGINSDHQLTFIDADR